MHRVRRFFQDLEAIEAEIFISTVFPFPYQTTPARFLEYAEEDLKQNTPQAAANSLSNSKRALDCELDYFLLAYGLSLHTKAQRFGTAKKIKLISDIGVVPSRILHKVNGDRNLLEHEYERPSRGSCRKRLRCSSNGRRNH